jgi:general secretion pathway protein G
MSARKRSQGFTLVEILIVVVILGILAAIVIPQFTSASEAAKGSSLISQLQTIRSQLELYQVQHNGQYPNLLTSWNQLTGTTDAAGDVAGSDFGPYLQQPPRNPFFSGAAATQVTDTSGGEQYAATGWAYNPTTGTMKAMVPNTVDANKIGLTNINDLIFQAPPEAE